MAEQIQRVFVPSAIEEGGNALSLGCFSSEETAWGVLRSFLKKSDQMLLESASVVVWDIDVIGEHGLTVLATLECKTCPVCSRKTFWVDLERTSLPFAMGKHVRRGLKKALTSLASSIVDGPR